MQLVPYARSAVFKIIINLSKKIIKKIESCVVSPHQSTGKETVQIKLDTQGPVNSDSCVLGRGRSTKLGQCESMGSAENMGN